MRHIIIVASCSFLIAVGAGFSRPAFAAAQNTGPGKAGSAVLVKALEAKDITTARTLLKQKADPNAADVEGMTPLHWAARWNDLDTVKQLIAAGARARVANRYGVTPLHEAATVGNAAMVNVLVKAGADVNAAYGEGETPLMVAARTGSVDVVRLLLEGGAQVNAAESFRGQTALIWRRSRTTPTSSRR